MILAWTVPMSKWVKLFGWFRQAGVEMELWLLGRLGWIVQLDEEKK